MNAQPKPLALVREAFTARPAMRSLVRACTAVALGAKHRSVPTGIAKSEWPNDDDAQLIIRAASDNPINLTTGAALERIIMPEFLATLTPQSAGAQLLHEGLMLKFDGAGQIQVPTLVADPSYASFVGDGQPIPVIQGLVEPNVTLKPQKLVALIVLTAEMLRSSNVEALMTDALIRSSALALDSVLFDKNPATAIRPAGLRDGIAALTASSAATEPTAVLDDIQTLCTATEDISAAYPVFIAAPTRALMMDLKSTHGIAPLQALGSAALSGTKDVIAVAPIALVSATGAVPMIEASRETTLHMDTVPTAIGTPGSPPVVAAPAMSTWQTDSVALKLRFPVTWGLRDQRGVAWLTATSW